MNDKNTPIQPAQLPKSEILKILEELGISGIVKTATLSAKLGISTSTIAKATQKGELKKIARNCYHVSDIANWLVKYPHYIAV